MLFFTSSGMLDCWVAAVAIMVSKEEKDRLIGYRDGANSFVRKPIEFAEFSEAIRQLGLYWLILNEPPPLPLKSEA
jgi:two-component system, response regulator